MDIADDIFNIWGCRGNGVGEICGRDGRYVNPVNSGGGVDGADMSCYDTCVIIYVKYLGWTLERGVDDFAWVAVVVLSNRPYWR